MGKIKSYSGLVEKDGHYLCEKCSGGKFFMVSHIDGKDFYGYSYQCEKCGSIASMSYERDKNDWMYMEDVEDEADN